MKIETKVHTSLEVGGEKLEIRKKKSFYPTSNLSLLTSRKRGTENED